MSIRNLFAFTALVVLAAFCAPRADAQDRYDRGDSVECRSDNYNYRRCPVPWREARLVRQLSDTACIRGQSWGIDRRGLWVDRGCGGVFVAGGGGGHGGGGWRPEPEWDRRLTLECWSEDYRYRFCAIDLGGGGRASLERQLSDSACIEGRTWGANRAGIWVDRGCAGVFAVDRRWR